MKSTLKTTMSVAIFGMTAMTTMLAQGNGAGTGAGQAQNAAQAKVQGPATVQSPAAAPAQKTPALQLHTLGTTETADPFPPVDAKKFTADTPTVAMVDGYLRAVLGYDSRRIWRVMSIEKTAAPGMSKVVTLVSERAPNAKVLTAVFFVTPDGKHQVADASGVQPFGPQPYLENRTLLQARADGPAHGATSKDLMLVEFTDLQCPRCKEAQATMTRLGQDFPKARIVIQNLPLAEVHPFAFEAASYGVCIAEKSSDAFLPYAQAVFDAQAALTAETGEQTLKNAAAKAGMDPVAIAACAATDATKQKVNASVKLASDLNVNQTPTLAVNGRLLPLAMPYESLKSIIVFQAGLDGVAAAAVSPAPTLKGVTGTPAAAPDAVLNPRLK